MGEAARCPRPVELVIESRAGRGVPQPVNDRKKPVLLLSSHQERAVPDHLVRAAMNCRWLDAQCRGRASRGRKQPASLDNAADDRVVHVLRSPMFLSPARKKGPPRTRRVDLGWVDADIRVLAQV